MDTNLVTLGIFSNCIDIIVQEHEPTKTVLQTIQQRLQYFSEKICELSHGEGRVVQTGSSYDGLHLSRCLQFGTEKHMFYPPLDFDFMMIYMNFKVLDWTGKSEKDVSNIIDTSSEAAVMVPSSSPGYVKLICTMKGRDIFKKPQCELERYLTKESYIPNFIFKTNVFPEQYQDVEVLYEREKCKYVTSGPALSDFSKETEGYSYDFVHSFPCQDWPAIANNWTRRAKPMGWPTNDLISEIVKDGCAVVPVGHHLSKEPELEWRVSFNLAEQKLSKSLSMRQRSCFTLVKFLMKSGLRQSSILTSYHVKNLMFWFCEQMYGEREWSEETQGKRIIQFIEYIANALAHGSVPHYFLPGNNLISHRCGKEIEETRVDVLTVKNRIFQTLVLGLCKLQCFESVEGFTDRNEVENMLLIYTSFVKILYKLGLMNVQNKIAERCFMDVVALNQSVKPYIKLASSAFSMLTLVDLLKPYAQAYAKDGQIDNAMALYSIMVKQEKTRVESEFPEAFSNLACLYNVKYGKEKDGREKAVCLEKADINFNIALNLITDSVSLHFAYGNFLLHSKKSLKLALEQFQHALMIVKQRSDDEVLIEITFPSKDIKTKGITHVSGKIATCYVLCDCLVHIGDIYEARKIARKVDDYVAVSTLSQKYSDLQVCSLVYKCCGLHVKADLMTTDAAKYSRVT